MGSDAWLVLLHTAATLAMTGLIWFVQIVHYPLFATIDASSFRAYEEQHVRRTTKVVAPLMLVELVTAIGLLLWPTEVASSVTPIVGICLLAVIWLSTAFGQVPHHRTLAQGQDQLAIRRLVASNWIRTIAWTLRSIVALQITGSWLRSSLT